MRMNKTGGKKGKKILGKVAEQVGKEFKEGLRVVLVLVDVHPDPHRVVEFVPGAVSLE